MAGADLSPDARQVLLALRALEAATSGALAVSSGLSLPQTEAALHELAASGEARCTQDGTWLVRAAAGADAEAFRARRAPRAPGAPGSEGT